MKHAATFITPYNDMKKENVLYSSLGEQISTMSVAAVFCT